MLFVAALTTTINHFVFINKSTITLSIKRRIDFRSRFILLFIIEIVLTSVFFTISNHSLIGAWSRIRTDKI